MTEADRSWEYAGRHYILTMGSDVLTRDGMYLELEDAAPAPGRGVVLEVFYSDADGAMTIISFTDSPLPVELVERFLSEARRRLPPMR